MAAAATTTTTRATTTKMASASSRSSAGPSRPAPRPVAQASRHHLEPNPFEQSFSSKPSGRSTSPSHERSSMKGDWEGQTRHKATKSDGGSNDDNADQNVVASSHPQSDIGKRLASANGTTTPNAKRILPPLSSIASPSGTHHEQSGSMQYPWSSSLSGSLRSGPLSPAMLAGPQNNFDPSSFRTGFTPDLSNFKTGLTPLGSASGAFPPPSPNTAAFLAMVANGGAPTPNTLNALGGNPVDAVQGNASSSNAAQQQEHSNDAEGRQQQQPQQPSEARKPMQSSPKSKRNHASNSNSENTNQAANGLFMLTQAHQELAKRNAANTAALGENFGSGVHDAKSLYDSVPNHGLNKAATFIEHNSKNGKRKNHPDGKHNPKKSKADQQHETAAGDARSSAETDELYDEMPRGSGQHASSSHGGGSEAGDFGNDEDEKRKNFLERNRQAALKCRQRKKAWLASLQTKVEYLQSDNEGLQSTVGALRSEVMFLKSQLMQAQRQLAANGIPLPPGPPMHASADMMGRHGGPGGGHPPPGMGMIPTAVTQVPHSNIHAMAAAAAAAGQGGNHVMNGGGQQQYVNGVSGMPRSSQMSAHAGSPTFNAATSVFGKAEGRQGHVQAV